MPSFLAARINLVSGLGGGGEGGARAAGEPRRQAVHAAGEEPGLGAGSGGAADDQGPGDCRAHPRARLAADTSALPET